MKKDSIDVIIPSLPQTREYLEYCIDSIIENKLYEETRVVVWLNMYSDEQITSLLKKYSGNKSVRFLSSENNEGQKVVNIVAELYSSADYIIVCNDDMVLPKDFDVILLNWRDVFRKDGHSERIVMSPKIVEPPTRKLPPHYISLDLGDSPQNFNREKFENLQHEDGNSKTVLTHRVTLPLFIPRKLWNAIGGYDMFVPLGAKSDDDLWIKFAYLNIPTFQLQNVFCYHFGGKGTDFNPALNEEWERSKKIANDILIKKWNYEQ
jgi:GT2 family glycosyltransferase